MNIDDAKALFATMFASDVDEKDTDNVQSNNDDGETPESDEAQNETSSEDTHTDDGEIFKALVEKLDERDKANTARIAKLEKKLEQLLNKGAATSEPERDASEAQEDYTPLLELDYATRPPKQ